MEITAALASYIYLISSCLLLPVLALLSLSTIWLMVYTGSFFATLFSRTRIRSGGDAIASLRSEDFAGFSRPVQDFIHELLPCFGKSDNEAAVINLIRTTESKLWKSLDPLKIVVRVGPGLGLIGTLIPMGTGLAGLSQGDISRLTGDLVIAFTTTVVGMAVGLLAYCFFVVQRRWVEEDIRHIELAAEILSLTVQQENNPQTRMIN